MRTAALSCLLVAVLVTWSVADARVTSESCPRDVSSATRHCLDEHNNHMLALRGTEKHFLAGVDVENIRALCQEFRRSLDCVRVMHEVCPRWKHEAIDGALRPFVAVFDMCTRRHFIEDYAMVQNCLHSQRHAIHVCYEQFTTSASNYEHHARQNHHSAVRTYCRHVSQLETCVKSTVRPWCGERAAHMTSILVNVSADLSYKCSARHHHHGSSVTTESSKLNHQSNSLAKTRSDNSSAPSWLSSQSFGISAVVIVVTSTAKPFFSRLHV